KFWQTAYISKMFHLVAFVFRIVEPEYTVLVEVIGKLTRVGQFLIQCFELETRYNTTTGLEWFLPYGCMTVKSIVVIVTIHDRILFTCTHILGVLGQFLAM